MVIGILLVVADETGFAPNGWSGSSRVSASALAFATVGFGLGASTGLFMVRADFGRTGWRGGGNCSGSVISAEGAKMSCASLSSGRSSGGFGAGYIATGAGGNRRLFL